MLHKHKWVVYVKKLFGGPEHVLHYLARYTHRVAISNHRLIRMEGGKVTFRWKDYTHGGKQRKMRLSATEFLRRFFLHVLPKGFVRIRHLGFLSNRFRVSQLAVCRQRLAMSTPEPPSPKPGDSTWHCPHCGVAMVVAQRLTAVEIARCSYFDSS